MAEWDELPAPWPEVFALMWEAYVAGTVPVGAVVVDESGEVVSRGRNRIFDSARDGYLGRSRLAHAEVNALAALPSDRLYEDFTLYTALEPCHLCLSAALSVQIGNLRYGSPDPYGGAVGKIVPSAAHEAHVQLEIVGPLDGTAGRLPEVLHLAHFLWRTRSAGVLGFYRRTRPELIAAADKLPKPDVAATLDDAFAALET
jgi:tRNA(adenine34) deaminase